MSQALLDRAPVRRVIDALAAQAVTDRVLVLDETARTAADAANAIGVPIGAIVKSLAFKAGADLVLACIAGDRRLEPAALVATLELEGPVGRADPKVVKERTGFTIGGVAPIGHLHPLPVALDVSLGRFEAIYAAAGHPHCVFRTSFDELQRLTGGRVGATFAVA